MIDSINRYGDLLNSVFPSMVVSELRAANAFAPRRYTNVAVIFVDVVGFTAYCHQHSIDEILKNLQIFVEICETMAIKNHVQKIKTIGDAFMGTTGMIEKTTSPVLDCIQFALDIKDEAKNELPVEWMIRTGIDFGDVIAGIVGHRQYLFDVWGDVVNTAARLQELSKPNHIILSNAAREQIEDTCHLTSLGRFKIKGKVPMELFEFIDFI